MLQHKQRILWLLFIILWSPSYCRQYISSGDDSITRDISQDEVILYNMINDMRRQAKLTYIPLSQSLCFVARTHINDLIISKPADKNCGPNSWSSAGKWTPCCDKKNPSSAKCMRSKPAEITGYPGNGYELIYWSEEPATPSDAAAMWKQVSASADMILSRGRWKGFQWKAIGIGIKEGYAIMWLGDKAERTTESSPIATVHSDSRNTVWKHQPFHFITNSKFFPESKRMFPFSDKVANISHQPEKEEITLLSNSGFSSENLLNKDGKAWASNQLANTKDSLQHIENVINKTFYVDKPEVKLVSDVFVPVVSSDAKNQIVGMEEGRNDSLTGNQSESVQIETNINQSESKNILPIAEKQAEPLPVIKTEENEKEVKASENQTPKAVSQVIAQKELSISPNIADTIPSYYVIVSSVKTAAGAQTELKRAKSKGFPEAFILEGTAVFRIALGSYKTNKLASVAAREVMKTFPGSWIMKQ